MSAIDECIRFVRGEGFGLLANRATDELAQLRSALTRQVDAQKARIEELEQGQCTPREREILRNMSEAPQCDIEFVSEFGGKPTNWISRAAASELERRKEACVCGVILTIHRGGHKDPCEWNPATNAPAKSDEPTHAEAAFIVGANGDWRLCARCVSLPRFARFKVHRTIHRGGTTEAK